MKIIFAESGISLTIECGIQIPLKDTVQESEIQYLESGIHGVESGIKHCPGFPYTKRNVAERVLLTRLLGYGCSLMWIL